MTKAFAVKEMRMRVYAFIKENIKTGSASWYNGDKDNDGDDNNDDEKEDGDEKDNDKQF